MLRQKMKIKVLVNLYIMQLPEYYTVIVHLVFSAAIMLDQAFIIVIRWRYVTFTRKILLNLVWIGIRFTHWEWPGGQMGRKGKNQYNDAQWTALRNSFGFVFAISGCKYLSTLSECFRSNWDRRKVRRKWRPAFVINFLGSFMITFGLRSTCSEGINGGG